jgi:hypothetical protein
LNCRTRISSSWIQEERNSNPHFSHAVIELPEIHGFRVNLGTSTWFWEWMAIVVAQTAFLSDFLVIPRCFGTSGCWPEHSSR